MAPNASASVGRVVGRAVVDDDQFVIGPGGVSEPSEAALEVAPPVVDGDHDREPRPPGPRARRTGGEIIHDPPSPVNIRAGRNASPSLGSPEHGASTAVDAGTALWSIQVSIQVDPPSRRRRSRRAAGL